MPYELPEPREASLALNRMPETVPCQWCSSPTAYVLTGCCNRCWELATRIERDPRLAQRMLERALRHAKFADPVASPHLQPSDEVAKADTADASEAGGDIDTARTGETLRIVVENFRLEEPGSAEPVIEDQVRAAPLEQADAAPPANPRPAPASRPKRRGQLLGSGTKRA